MVDLTTSYLREKFDYYNNQIFNNELPQNIIFEVACVKTWAGLFVPKKRNNAAPKIRISTMFATSLEDVNNTLIHEMIHYYLYFKGVKQRSAHDYHFTDIMYNINRRFPEYHITVGYKYNAMDHASSGNVGNKTFTIVMWQISGSTFWNISVVKPEHVIKHFALVNTIKNVRNIKMYTSKNMVFESFRQNTGKMIAYHRVTEDKLKELDLEPVEEL